MTEEGEVIQGEIVPLGTIEARGPADIVARGSEIATALKEIIDKQELFTKIGDRQFVRVEGWNTLGAMLGVMPRELQVARLYRAEGPAEPYGYEATVELVRVTDGMVVGRGSAICTRDERNWASRDDYAVRSMAITRATGKAYRPGFSWIIALAGYEPTPAEEMAEESPKANSRPGNSKLERPLSPEQLKYALHKKIAGSMRGTTAASREQRGLVAGKLEECFAPAKESAEMRHVALGWLFGKESVKDLTMAEASALIDWMLDPNGEDYALHSMAPQEAAAVYNQAIEEMGQQKLELGDD